MVNAKRLPRRATLAKLLVSYNVTPEAHACRAFNALLSLERLLAASEFGAPMSPALARIRCFLINLLRLLWRFVAPQTPPRQRRAR
jgi:hypothetical protein